jgi:hypothetical protein
VIADVTRQSYIGEPLQYLIAFFGLAGLRQADLWLDAVYVSLMMACVFLLYLYLREVGQENQAQAELAVGSPAERSVRPTAGSTAEVGGSSGNELRLS